MRRAIQSLVLILLALTAPALLAQSPAAKPLEIYVVDTEGGKADLWVTPSGQTVLIDAGSPGGRDTDRILETLAAAGVKQIDWLLLTHYHVDHVGGVQELVKRVPPIAHFVDHGPTAEDGAEGHQREQVAGFQAAYADLYSKAQHIVVKPGDRVPIPGLDWRIVTSAGKVLKNALPGGGRPNPECAQTQRQAEARDPENAQSVGSVVGFGSFRALDFGDLTRDVEFDLMCPNNPIGTIDLYFASNHGTNNANSAALIHAVQPRAAIVQNGTGKGASVDMFQALRSTPGFEDVWQLHWANGAGLEYNSPGVFIANGVDPAVVATVLTAPPGARGARGGGPLPPHTPAYWIKVSVQQNGTFTITNSRNGFSKTYAHRSR
jgi:beta-lactamase superfamily II metal-dependent hydrolase